MKSSNSQLNSQSNSANQNQPNSSALNGAEKGNLHNPSDTLNSSNLLPDNQFAEAPCNCGCLEVTAALSSTIHWAAWHCIGCGNHRGWIENPDSAAKRESQDQLIDRLLGVATGWNRMFLEELRKKRKRSPKQLEKLSEIATRYLGGAS